MRDLALLLRKKRIKRGSLQLEMPEAVLEYDADGRVSGGALRAAQPQPPNRRRVHARRERSGLQSTSPSTRCRSCAAFTRHRNEEKLEAFAQFADLLGHPMKRAQDRFELQRVLTETADKPERAAVHFALLRSLKQATYSPVQDEHYALASKHYCHFTSPIRRYPDLQVSPTARPVDSPRQPRVRMWKSWPRWANTARRWNAGPRPRNANW